MAVSWLINGGDPNHHPFPPPNTRWNHDAAMESDHTLVEHMALPSEFVGPFSGERAAFSFRKSLNFLQNISIVVIMRSKTVQKLPPRKTTVTFHQKLNRTLPADPLSKLLELLDTRVFLGVRSRTVLLEISWKHVTWTLRVGRWTFFVGARSILRGELLVLGSVSNMKMELGFYTLISFRCLDKKQRYSGDLPW